MAKRAPRALCSSASSETAQVSTRESTSSIRESSRTEIRTSGGSSDTERNDVAVMPTSSPFGPSSGSWTVTSVTPEASWDRAARNSSGVARGAAAGCGDEYTYGTVVVARAGRHRALVVGLRAGTRVRGPAHSQE